ncbi:MAG: two-component regulator propeller domain-containing protein [Ferruginibacter sp.]
MKPICCVYIFIISFLFSKETLAQSATLNFNPLTGSNGKSLGKIMAITQDKQGYMWFASETEKCIYRYDGYRTISFKHDDANPNSLGGTGVRTVCADEQGIIWIGLGEGLDRFDPATGIFKHYRHTQNAPSSISGGVHVILIDRQGRLWFGTHEGLDRFEEKTGKFIHYRNEPGNPKSLSDNVVWNIYEDHQGVIWVATGFPFYDTLPGVGGLNRLNPDGTFTRYMHDAKDPHSLISNKVRAMFEDSRGVFWVGTKGDGLHTLDRKTGKFERYLYNPNKPDQLSRPPLKKEKFSFDNDQVTFITEDITGSIWIGSMWSGINRYDTLTKKITHYEGSNGFPDSSAWNAFISRDGVLWLSTQSNNLFRVGNFPKTINSINAEGGGHGILEDAEGGLWIGTNGNGLLQYDRQKYLVQHFNVDRSEQNSLFDSSIICLFQNNRDTIWLGTGDGVGIFNTVTKKFSKFPLGFSFKDRNGSAIFSIFQDKKGFKWFATGEGIVRYNAADGSFKGYQHNEDDSGSISSNRIISFLEDRDAEFWVGAVNGGINLLNRQTDRFKHYLRGSNGICMFQDKEGIIWAGTDKGLYKYNKRNDTFLPYFDAYSEFSIAFIFGLMEDSMQNLWVVTPSAIVKINRARDETFLYGSNFGIPTFSLSPNAIYKTREGQLIIGKENGFFVFLPEELELKKDFKILTTNFFINNRNVLPGKESPLQKPVEEINELSLKYNQNSFAFNFATNDYRSPQATRYFTMLENYDNEWREAMGEKSSSYFYVPPGKYVFRIKAFNIDGTKAVKAITLIINPPWWKTWWAYSAYGLLLLLSIFAIYRYQKQRIIHLERQKRQQFELAQAKEIEKAYTELKSTQALLIQSEKMASLGELTAGIAHEIQNPLNFVNNFSEINTELIDELQQDLKSGKIDDAIAISNDLKENEEKINHHGKRADAIVKGMLQHSRTSAGQKEPTDINALCDEYLRLSYHGLRAKDKNFNADFKTDFDETMGKVNIVPQEIGRVLLNLYNNAFYATNEKKKTASEEYKPLVTVQTKKINARPDDTVGQDKVEIKVSDNGNGIPKNIVDKIFQPFFTTKPTGQGTGLGLSLSYDIIKAHGGEIKVETKGGEGTEFIIQLQTN